MKQASTFLSSKAFVFARRSVYTPFSFFDALINHQPKGIVVLCYHSLASSGWEHSTPYHVFARQITYVAERYPFLSASELEAVVRSRKKLDRRCFVLTFDDGYASIVKAKPLLEKLGIKPIFFVLAKPAEANRAEMQTKEPLLTKAAVARLLKAGWTLGCHSATHADMTALTRSDLIAEVNLAKHQLEKQFMTPVRYFAYPKGRYDKRSVQAVKQAGYALAFSMDDGVIASRRSTCTLPRIGINGTHNFAEFKASYSASALLLRKTIKQSAFIRKFIPL